MILIQNRDGLQIKKKNLSYPELKRLVEKYKQRHERIRT